MAYMGWDSLKNRYDNKINQERIESHLGFINQRIGPITNQIETIQRYEKTLTALNHKDEAVASVLAQYQSMKSAIETFEKYRGTKNESEKANLADNILSLISSELIPVQTFPEHPNQPLILNLAPNIFKVLFAVPMRIPPNITFTGIPNGITPQFIEKTKFGFTVKFEPQHIAISSFDFTADARL